MRVRGIGAPETLAFISKKRNDSHAMRGLRCPSGLIVGKEMWPLCYTLLWARMPETTLGRGGHDKLCKPIKRAGGAEQYNANTKYAQSVAVAAEKCADDTKGQTCYICTQAVHRHTKEGLAHVRVPRHGGFAHVSCLAEQAKILPMRANNNCSQWHRWHTCSLCEQATTASWHARSGGRAGRRTWGGRRRTRLGNWR